MRGHEIKTLADLEALLPELGAGSQIRTRAEQRNGRPWFNVSLVMPIRYSADDMEWRAQDQTLERAISDVFDQYAAWRVRTSKPVDDDEIIQYTPHHHFEPMEQGALCVLCVADDHHKRGDDNG